MKIKYYWLLPLAFAAGAALAHGKEAHEQKPAIDYSKAEEKAFGKLPTSSAPSAP